MKQLLLLALLPALLLTACDKEKIIDTEDLPADVRGYVQTHYGSVAIRQAVKERDDLKISYYVYLENGTKLTFARNGDIKEIEGTTPIPDSALPALIVSYVSANYPGAFIKEWEIDDATQDVELSNNVKLEFDRHGNFLRIDN